MQYADRELETAAENGLRRNFIAGCGWARVQVTSDELAEENRRRETERNGVTMRTKVSKAGGKTSRV